MNKEELATEILEKVIGKHLSFVITETEFNMDGSISTIYSTRAQNIYNDILKLLEENETNI